MDLRLLDKELPNKFIFNSKECLQFRWVGRGKYKDKAAFGKFFHFQDTTAKSRESSGSIEEYKQWSYKALVNSIYAHQVLSNAQEKIGIDLGIPKIFESKILPEGAFIIVEFIEGELLTPDKVGIEQLEKIAIKLSNWQSPKLTAYLNSKIHSSDLTNWYTSSYKDALYWLVHSFNLGKNTDGIDIYKKDTPIKDFFSQRKIDSNLVGTIDKINNSKQIQNLFTASNHIRINHNDPILGWTERNNRNESFGGNIMLSKYNTFIIDYDWVAITKNQALSYFQDHVKLFLYLASTPEKAQYYKEFVISNSLIKDKDLYWSLSIFFHGITWELPYWIRAFNTAETQDSMDYISFNWLIKNIKAASKYINNHLKT